MLAILATAAVVSAQEVSADQLKLMMEKSAVNLTTYTYSRSSESDIRYSNASLKTEFDVYKATEGNVDLVNMAGMWSSKLTDEESRQVLSWDGYFVNGSEYWKEGQNWTKFTINDTARIMQDYNEIPGQVNLIMFSNMKIADSEKFQARILMSSSARQRGRYTMELPGFSYWPPTSLHLSSCLRSSRTEPWTSTAPVS